MLSLSTILSILKGAGAWLKTLLPMLAVWWGRGKQIQAADAKQELKAKEAENAILQKQRDVEPIVTDADLLRSVERHGKP